MYEEITPAPPLNQYGEAVWHSCGLTDISRETIVYPDCCADIIFTFSPTSFQFLISGAMTTARAVNATDETTFISIRFKQGFAGFNIPTPYNE